MKARVALLVYVAAILVGTTVHDARLLALGLGIGADVGHDHLAAAFRDHELADAVVRPTGVIADHHQVTSTLLDQRVDQPVRRTNPHEAADHEHGSVGNQRCRLGDGHSSFQRTFLPPDFFNPPPDDLG